jgi:hypothetical protein
MGDIAVSQEPLPSAAAGVADEGGFTQCRRPLRAGRRPASTMAAVQRWCAENNYYLKYFIIEAIEERLKRGYPR